MGSQKSVVVDTNVFVRALSGKGASSKIYELLKQDSIRLVLSEHLLAEIREVLSREKFGFTGDEIESLMGNILRKAEIVTPTERIEICRDTGDNILLECAVCARADFIITHDRDLLTLVKFRKIPIVTPSEFLKLLAR